MPRAPFELGGTRVAPGQRATVDLPVSVMSDHTPVTLSIHVVHGRRPGPVLFVSAAIHGDEIIGVEIVRRLLRARPLARMAGTLIAVPIVNSFGFLGRSRYLPDRRDLNRAFPGSGSGSLAARLANLFMAEIVDRADLGIDLHSAAIHRTNLPQIRVSAGNDRARGLATAFGAPVVLTSGLREGSLRAAAEARGTDVLLFEAGEGLRFDEGSARAGVTGILRVMRALGMIPSRAVAPPRVEPLHCPASSWLRAPAGGLLRSFRSVGDIVRAGQTVGIVSDPFGEVETGIDAASTGIIVGRTNLPVVNEGDALFHVAEIPSPAQAEAALDHLTEFPDGDSLSDEGEII